jgi:hypothetical protein
MFPTSEAAADPLLLLENKPSKHSSQLSLRLGSGGDKSASTITRRTPSARIRHLLLRRHVSDHSGPDAALSRHFRLTTIHTGCPFRVESLSENFVCLLLRENTKHNFSGEKKGVLFGRDE